jgi:hypothetical protein
MSLVEKHIAESISHWHSYYITEQNMDEGEVLSFRVLTKVPPDWPENHPNPFPACAKLPLLTSSHPGGAPP